jgi:hypothetical protein
MKNIICLLILLCAVFFTLQKVDGQSPTAGARYAVAEYDGTISSSFGDVPYRIYYPKNSASKTYAIIVSAGGNGEGEDRGKLLFYIREFVATGYLVVQIDHRNAGNNFEKIAQFRGQEVQFISEKITKNQLSYGEFAGTVDGTKQGFFGHSAGCLEGLLAAGVNTTHGNYRASSIKAVYGMSAPGYSPDVWGITQSPNGFAAIENTAIFLITGEQEKDGNGPGTVTQTDWRLQGFSQMNEKGLRIQVLAKGQRTQHRDIGGLNAEIKNFSVENSIALFDTFLKGLKRQAEIGTLNLPKNNELVITKKGKP